MSQFQARYWILS